MASTRNLMKFTDIVRDHYRGPAYGQEFTTWYTKVQHGFSTAQVPPPIYRETPYDCTQRPYKHLSTLAPTGGSGAGPGGMRNHPRRRALLFPPTESS